MNFMKSKQTVNQLLLGRLLLFAMHRLSRFDRIFQ